jgi:hypothetical protein
MTRLLLALIVISQSACLVGPTSYRLEFPTQDGSRCGSVSLPGSWTFDTNPNDAGGPLTAQIGFEARRERGSEAFLLAGRFEKNGESVYSVEKYRISFASGGPNAIPVEARQWSEAGSSQLVRKSAGNVRSDDHQRIEPKVEFAGKTFPLSGNMFWDAQELTKLSASGRYLLGISYNYSPNALRPRNTAHFDLFSIATGKLLWSASGEGPPLPPFSQFEAVGWIGDDILFMPLNGAATRFDVCQFVPQALERTR